MSMRPDRKAERPISHLAGFKGILQVDGYGGYRTGCWPSAVTYSLPSAGPRRRGRPSWNLPPPARSSIASEALERIARSGRRREGHPCARRMSGEPCARTGAGRSSTRSSSLAVRQAALISQKTKLAEAIRRALRVGTGSPLPG